MQPRYSRLNKTLHWITVICMFAILPLAWVMVNMSPHASSRDTLVEWHKTLGIIVLFITAFRIVWRFVDGPPPYPPAIAKWERAFAHAAYWLFFAALVWMPVSGFLLSSLSGHPVRLFNLIPTPGLPVDKPLARFFLRLHLAGQWAIYALIALHLSAIAMHVTFRKSGVLGRMLPTNAAEPAPAARASIDPASAI